MNDSSLSDTATAGQAPVLLQSGRVAICTLNVPDRLNAISSPLMDALTKILHGIAADSGVRALILTGAGRAFCAGADIDEFGALLDKPGRLQDFNRRLEALVEQLAALPLPVVAAINGPCFGGGLSLALACDLRLSVADAVFALTPGRLGLMYGLGDSRRLIRAVGHSRASDFLLTGRRFAADEAQSAGILHRQADKGTLMKAAMDLAKTLAKQSPASAAATKAMLSYLSGGSGSDAEFEDRYSQLFAGEDAREGAAAFREKREPAFRDRS